MPSSGTTPSTAPSSWLSADYLPGLVSVIVPTYNRAHLLVETLASVRAQTWRSLEVVVVDDGSTDETLKVLETLAPLGEERTLRVISQPNSGVSAARNRGTRSAKGEFFIYLDSDDLLVPDAVAQFVEALRGSGADYCFASVDTVDKDGCRVPDAARWHSKPSAAGDLFTNLWLVHAACYRRALVDRAGTWNESLPCCEDTEFNLRIKLSGRGIHLPRVQGFYRMHGADQLTQIHDHSNTFSYHIPMLDSFVDWLKKRGPIDPSVTQLLVDYYRFLAVRMGHMRRVDEKNQALRRIDQLLSGTWSLRRLYLLGRWFNSPKLYTAASYVKWKVDVWLRALTPGK